MQISEGVFAAMQEAVSFTPEQTVMDFGASTGLVATRIAPMVANVLAVDVSPAMLEQLAEKPELKGRAEVI
ncbi:MAG: putative TPR repeat methyltransferase [Myxococcota bacterium]|jgi:predicted TPR repeat methyltransferase